MTPVSMADMKEATRLTREGRLTEAMALLRGANAGQLSPAPTSGPTSGPIDRAIGGPAREAPTILDMVPPSSITGNAWTAPEPSASNGRDRADGLLARFARRPGAAARNDGFGRSDQRGLPEGASFQQRLYAGAAGSLAYKLYIPSNYTGQPVPLVVMLHGCTQSPDDFAAGTRMNELAEEQGFLVAYPAQSATANMSKCWNWFRPTDQRRDQGEPSLIAGLTRQVMQDFAVDPGRVHVVGLSAGGAAAAILGATYPDLYAAVGIHSGLACGAARDMTSAMTAMRQGAGSASAPHPSGVPTIVFHGDGDATVNPVNGEQIIARSPFQTNREAMISRGTSAGGMAYTRRVYTDGSGRPVLEHWLLHGAGHAWSGGSAAGSYTDPKGPNAGREMLRFFAEQAKGR